MRFATTLFVGLAALAVARPVGATTVLLVPIEEMARGSDLIVRATVAKVQVVTANDDPRQIWTKVTLRIQKVYKGHQTAPLLTLTLLGGHKGRWTLAVPGMPTFRRGADLILFLEKTRRGFVPAGLSMGKFDVFRDPASGRLKVRRTLAGLNVLVRGPDGRLQPAPPGSGPDVMDLETLERIIQEALSNQGGER